MWTLSGWREQSQACNPRSERRGPTSALPSGIVDLCAHSRRHGECKFYVWGGLLHREASHEDRGRQPLALFRLKQVVGLTSVPTAIAFAASPFCHSIRLRLPGAGHRPADCTRVRQKASNPYSAKPAGGLPDSLAVSRITKGKMCSCKE